jgi:alpha/beta superfamily hydrolase
VALFDSSGSGMSDGEYITLGVQEAEDLEAVIEFVTTQRNVKEIALWGRSMGAVAGIKYGYAALIYVANTDR